MKTKTDTTTETIDCTPSWTFAVEVYIRVLENPDAPFKARKDAREELLRLASIVDQRSS